MHHQACTHDLTAPTLSSSSQPHDKVKRDARLCHSLRNMRKRLYACPVGAPTKVLHASGDRRSAAVGQARDADHELVAAAAPVAKHVRRPDRERRGARPRVPRSARGPRRRSAGARAARLRLCTALRSRQQCLHSSAAGVSIPGQCGEILCFKLNTYTYIAGREGPGLDHTASAEESQSAATRS